MTIDCETKHRVLWILINRPERGNSLDPPTLVALRQTLIDAQSNSDINLIVLTGAGEKDFCTGIDINSAQNLTSEGKVNLANVAGDIATLIYSGKPVICGINGRAMGMGIVFAAAADYRLCIDTAMLRMPEIEVGIFPGASCIAIMTRTCGLANTRRILMFGEVFTPLQGMGFQLIDEIYSSSEFLIRLAAIVKAASHHHPILSKALKNTINAMPMLSYNQGIALESSAAKYYEWQDPEMEWKNLADPLGIQYELTGNPEQLLQDYDAIINQN